MIDRRFALTLLLTAVLIGTAVGPASAQDTADTQPAQTTQKNKTQGRKFAKKPLLRAWFSIDEREVSEYFENLMKEYEFESPFLSGALKAGRQQEFSKPKLQGMMVFMAKGLIPAAVQMQFRTVKDEAEFKDVIFMVKSQLGQAATLSGSGDHYVLDLDFSQGIPVFGASDDDEGSTEPKLIQFPGQKEIRENPEVLAQLQQTIHFRLIDNVMWQGDMPEIMEFDFPTYDELQPTESQKRFDVYGEFNLEEVPAYIKGILFNAVNLTAKAQLQQRDDEEDLTYETRRANGDLWLELLRTIVYDIDKGRFSIQVARDDKPIRVRLDLDARNESSLAKVGRTISGVGTRFGAIRNRKAPLTIASSWGMPEQTKKLFRASLALAQREWRAELSEREDMLAAADRIGEVLSDTIEAGQADMVVQLTGDVITGFAIVGGVRLQEAERFRQSSIQLAQALHSAGSVEQSEDAAGRKYLSLGTGQAPIPGSEDKFDGSFHITTYDSCLWFSWGGPSSLALLEDTIAYAEEHRRDAARSEAFYLGFDLSEWLAGSDEVDGFNQYPRQALMAMEQKMDEGIDRIYAQLSGAGDDEFQPLPQRASFLEKALKRGGDEVDLRLVINKEGVNLKLDIGLGVANMFMARMIDFQGKVMDAMMNNESGAFGIR